MLQNAIDSTLLRASIGLDGYLPQVRIVLDQSEVGDVELVVEDNGIGMSERVLTKRLLDFGSSGWRSNDVLLDNPELSGSVVSASGKFGIGFFSTFLLGDDVTVITRPYKAGIDDGRALEFVGLNRRPILRRANTNEQDYTFVTRIRIKILDKFIKEAMLPEVGMKGTSRSRYFGRHVPSGIDNYLKQLVVTSAVNVQFIDRIANRSFTHSQDWESRSSEEFLRDILSPAVVEDNERLLEVLPGLLSDLRDDEGHVVGRAAIFPGENASREAIGFASVGGLTYPTSGRMGIASEEKVIIPKYAGVIKGDAFIATRGQADLIISNSTLSNWATDQAQLGLNYSLSIGEKLNFARSVYWAGGDALSLPIGFYDGSFLSVGQMKEVIRSADQLFFPVNRAASRSEDFYWRSTKDLKARYFSDKMSAGTCISSFDEHTSAFSRESIDGRRFEPKINETVPMDCYELINLNPYDIILDLIRKLDFRYSLRFEVKNIFDDGLTVDGSSYGFALSIER